MELVLFEVNECKYLDGIKCLIFFFFVLLMKICRMALLLGPPGSGKTTLLLALAGKLDKELKVFENLYDNM